MSDQVNEVVDKEFPRWYYGPDGQSRIFQRGEEVPEGWEDHPSKVAKVIEEVEVVDPKAREVGTEPKVGKGGRKSDKKDEPKTPKAKEEAKTDEGKLDEGKVSDEAASTEEVPEFMTKAQIYDSCMVKDMPELWAIAKDLKIDHSGKKHELADRIAETMFGLQEVNEPEKTV